MSYVPSVAQALIAGAHLRSNHEPPDPDALYLGDVHAEAFRASPEGQQMIEASARIEELHRSAHP